MNPCISNCKMQQCSFCPTTRSGHFLACRLNCVLRVIKWGMPIQLMDLNVENHAIFCHSWNCNREHLKCTPWSQLQSHNVSRSIFERDEYVLVSTACVPRYSVFWQIVKHSFQSNVSSVSWPTKIKRQNKQRYPHMGLFLQLVMIAPLLACQSITTGIV